jgi:hypothetical protein
MTELIERSFDSGFAFAQDQGCKRRLTPHSGRHVVSIAIVAPVGQFDRCDESPRWISSPHPCDRSGNAGNGSNSTRSAGIEPRRVDRALAAPGQAQLDLDHERRHDLQQRQGHRG